MTPTILTGTPTEITEAKKSYQSKMGGTIYVHSITMQYNNGTETGEWHSTSSTCNKFTVGVETKFERSVRQNGQYTNIVYKPVNEQKPSNGYKPGGYSGSSKYSKLDLICNNKVKLTIAATDIAIQRMSVEGIPAGHSFSSALALYTEETMAMMLEQSGLNKVIKNYTAELSSEKESGGNAQQNQHHPEPKMNAPVFNTIQDIPKVLPEDDLPF
jgi:hypothetical protein